MGIVIGPILFGALVILGVCVSKIIKWEEKGELDLKIFVFGLNISILIYLGIILSYLSEGKMWALSPCFRLPVWMIYIPSLIGLILFQIQNKTTKVLAKSIIVSTISSAILILLLCDYVIGIWDLLGIEKHY